MSSNFVVFRNLIQPLVACLNGVVDITSREVLDELQFMDDERIKYIQPKNTCIIGLSEVEHLIRYCSDLYNLCHCLFFSSKIDLFASKPVHSLIVDKSQEQQDIYVTDSLVVELIFKVYELCVVFMDWMCNKLEVSSRVQNKTPILMSGYEIPSVECESILGCIKSVIGLINAVRSPSVSGSFSYEPIIKEVDGVHRILQAFNTHHTLFRVLGCWIWSLGMTHEKKEDDIETKRMVSMYLASALAIMEEESKVDNPLKTVLREGISIDMNVQFAELQYMYNELDIAYRYFKQAEALGWKDKQNKKFSVCKDVLKDKAPTNHTTVDTKPLADGTILKKGKIPRVFAVFKLSL
jgi:hypothetical protein